MTPDHIAWVLFELRLIRLDDGLFLLWPPDDGPAYRHAAPFPVASDLRPDGTCPCGCGYRRPRSVRDDRRREKARHRAAAEARAAALALRCLPRRRAHVLPGGARVELVEARGGCWTVFTELMRAADAEVARSVLGDTGPAKAGSLSSAKKRGGAGR